MTYATPPCQCFVGVNNTADNSIPNILSIFNTALNELPNEGPDAECVINFRYLF